MNQAPRPSLAAVLLLLWAVPLRASTLEIKLVESVPAPGNNLVQLRLIDVSVAPAELATNSPTDITVARTGDSNYTLALKSIERTGTNHYLTYEFLVWNNNGDRRVARVLYNVTSTGSFADFFKDIPFSVNDGAITS